MDKIGALRCCGKCCYSKVVAKIYQGQHLHVCGRILVGLLYSHGVTNGGQLSSLVFFVG